MTQTSHFWHGFTDMSVISQDDPLALVRGEGEYVFDSTGKRYLDASAALWNANVGHGRREIAQAAYDQLAKLQSYSTFGDFTNEPAEELATRLAGLSPLQNPRVFFTSGGSDTTDTAIKLVRHYWEVLGKPAKRTIISRTSAYHGCHMGSTALGGIALDREGYGELITDTDQIAWNDAEALEQSIARIGADRVGAFICEPVIAAGGCLFPPSGYLERIAEICRAHDVLLIFDEVVTGYGRVGDWFGASRFGVDPDLLITAKGLTSGYAPLGALLVGERVWSPYYDGTAGPWFHGYTYSGHAASAAVALANLDVVENERLIDNVRFLEPQLPTLLAELTAHPAVSEVRTGEGLMAAVWLDDRVIAENPKRPAQIVQAMRSEGVLTRPLVNGQIQFSPALTARPDHVREFTAAALTGLEATEPARSLA